MKNEYMEAKKIDGFLMSRCFVLFSRGLFSDFNG